MFKKQIAAVKEGVETVKEKVEDHKRAYIYASGGVIIAVFTCAIMRDRSSSIRGGISAPAQGGISVLGNSLTIKNSTLNNVAYISSDRQGPPSWVVRCKETGNVFTSQKAAALEMELPQSEISKQLNGLMDHVRGFTFERICMAA